MNRTLMLLIPIVILVAMGLILLQQMWSGQEGQMQPESVAGGSLPFTNSSAPKPLSSSELDEAIRKEQLNRAQSAPELPRLDGMPANVTPPVATPPAVAAPQTAPAVPVAQGGNTAPATAAHANENVKSELGKLADASAAGQPGKGANSGAADELARQVASGSDEGGKQSAKTGATPAPTATATKAPQEAKAAKEVKAAEEAKGPEEAKPGDKVAMTAISLKAEGSDMILTVSADKRFSYKSFVLTGPDRLVIDLAGEWSGVKIPGMPSNRLITKVRGGKFENSHRIVLDLKAPLAGYEAKREGDNTLVVRMH